MSIKTKTGIVTSNKLHKTLTVEVTSLKEHALYKKKYKVSKKFLVNNPNIKKYKIGDKVVIYETKPVSKRKCWKIKTN